MVVKMTPIQSILFTIFVPILLGLLAGIGGAVLKNWTMVKFLMELEYRLADCEGRVNRETKKRAQEMSVESRKGSDDLVEWAKDNAGQPNVGNLNFSDWRKSKMVSPVGK